MNPAQTSIGDLLGARGDRAERPRNAALVWLERYSPRQGWATLAFLMLALLIVADSISAAEWVEMDGLTAVMAWSALVGLALAKTPGRWFALIPAGVAIGAAAVAWQASTQVEGANAAARFAETLDRLAVWWDAATTGGISIDLLPFFIAMLAIGWLVGFLSAWFIFRYDNVWVSVVLLGTAILTNLSFLPEWFGIRFFIFAFLAMLLVVRVSVIQRHERWKRREVGFSPATGWATLHAAAWLSAAVLLIAVILPMRVYTNETVASAWTAARAPVAAAESFFSRMFAALPSKKDQPGRLFGKWLPFIGGISFGGEPAAWATTDYPSYWLSQTYNYYTPKGWIATDTEILATGPDTLAPPRADNLKREARDQTMQVGFETDKTLVGGAVDWVDRRGTAEALAPRKFAIYMNDASVDAEFPPEVRALAENIRTRAAGMSADRAQAAASGILPDDMLIVEAREDSSGAAEAVVIQRKAPAAPDLVAWSFDERLVENERYAITSYVSVASEDDLRTASDEYEAFISDHYLQLPSSLPARVRELAERVTADADTPLDKALAVRDYLRGDDFTFERDIEPPPADADGVDWFLFDAKTGYSDYYASAMSVMLRAAGVPARVAAGYAPGGEPNELGERMIRDSDSHSWTQVYFPDYGWIDFEPSPNWQTHRRTPYGAGGLGLTSDPLEQEPDGGVGPFGLDPMLEDDITETGGGGGPLSFDAPDYTPYLLAVAAGAAAIGGLWLLWSAVWNFGLRGLPPEARLYGKMTRLGWLAGAGRRANQTPIEYGERIAQAAPDAAEGARKIASAYARARYGEREPSDGEREEIEVAWRGARLAIARRVFRMERNAPAAR